MPPPKAIWWQMTCTTGVSAGRQYWIKVSDQFIRREFWLPPLPPSRKRRLHSPLSSANLRPCEDERQTMSKASMLDQIRVRVMCVNCGPAEVPLANVKGKRSHACGRCGFEIRLDREPLRSHLAMLLSEADELDARRRRSGYMVARSS